MESRAWLRQMRMESEGGIVSQRRVRKGLTEREAEGLHPHCRGRHPG